MKLYVYILVALCSVSMHAQELKVVFTGDVTNQSKTPLKGSMIYLIQNQITLDASIVGNKGGFVISSLVKKNVPFVLQVSNPGYVTQRYQFNLDGVNIPKRSLNYTIKPVDTLSVALVPINPLINFTVTDKDFADKYKWDDKSQHCLPDLVHRKKYVDSLNQRIKDEEGRQLIQLFKGKSTAFEQVKNYQLAIQYLDSAAKKATLYKLQDSTIDRKKTILQKALTEQSKEIAKKREIDSLYRVGDSLLAVLKFKEAEAPYKLILKKDPTAEKAKTKLASIAGMVKEEGARQKELATYKTNRTACYNAVKGKKYADAIKAIQKNLSLTRIPQSYKDGIPKTVDSLNVLLKEDNLQKELTTELNKFKTAKSKIDLSGMKGSIDKIQGICSNFKDTTKRKSVNPELDKLVNSRVDEDIRNAYKLHSNGKTEYDKAIGEYEKIKGFISLISDSALRKQRLSEADIKIADARKNKEEASQKLQQALTTFNNYLDSLSFNPQLSPAYSVRLAKLKSMLTAPPFKAGFKEKPMVDMIARYKKLERYFSDNKKSVPLMNQKDSIKALAVANELLIKAGANDLGKLEVAFLKATVDSIKLKVSPLKQQVANTVRGTKILPPSGATLVGGNTQDAFDELSFTAKRNEALNKEAWDQLKESVNRKNFEAGQQEELRSDSQREFQERHETTRAVLSEQEAAQAKVRELQNIETVESTIKAVDNRNLENLALTNRLADESVKTKDVIDQVNLKQGLQNEAARQNTREFVDSMNTRREVIALDESQRNKAHEVDQREFLDDNEKTRVNQELYVERQHKSGQRAQEKIADYVDTRTYSPNYLKDTAGNCLKWNHMTEFIYQFQNELGFTTSILVRRVVVNKDGYGVIYEKITSDSGKCAYSLNGQPIPESIWLHDSTGESIFIQDGPIEPVGCQ